VGSLVSASDHDYGGLKAMQPSMDPRKALLLGRIEQIAGNSARLPSGVTSAADNSQPSSKQSRPSNTRKLSAPELLRAALSKKSEISTSAKGGDSDPSNGEKYPEYLFRRWGAILNVRSRVIDKPNPADMPIDVNEKGVALFSIEKTSAGPVIKPSAIVFRHRTLAKQNAWAARIPPDSARWSGVLQALGAPVTWTPVISLGAAKSMNTQGGEWEDAVVSNYVHRMSSDTAEQDVISKRFKDGKLYGFRESVIQFQFTNATRCLVKVAVSDYGPNGVSYKRTILEGEASPSDSSEFAEVADRAAGLSPSEIERRTGN
jgi:hypothetical protein